jgi:hypothetical protein
VPDAYGKLPGICLILPDIQPIQNGISAASFPAECGRGMAIGNGTGEGARAAIYHPITWRAMNGIAMRDEGFRQYRRRLGPKRWTTKALVARLISAKAARYQRIGWMRRAEAFTPGHIQRGVEGQAPRSTSGRHGFHPTA